MDSEIVEQLLLPWTTTPFQAVDDDSDGAGGGGRSVTNELGDGHHQNDCQPAGQCQC